MPRGLPASYIKKAQRELGSGASWSRVFKRAWQLYKQSSLYKKVYKGERKKSSRKVKRRMPRRRRSSRRKRRVKRKASLAITAGVIASLMSANRNNAFGQIASGDVMGGLQNLSREIVVNYTGWDYVAKDWNFGRLLEGYGPIIIGAIAHKIAGWLGLNRYFSKIPVIGKYFNL